jgi:ethanolamine ammonia-lyase large subunit
MQTLRVLELAARYNDKTADIVDILETIENSFEEWYEQSILQYVTTKYRAISRSEWQDLVQRLGSAERALIPYGLSLPSLRTLVDFHTSTPANAARAVG